jgi:hypothetical protein
MKIGRARLSCLLKSTTGELTQGLLDHSRVWSRMGKIAENGRNGGVMWRRHSVDAMMGRITVGVEALASIAQKE